MARPLREELFFAASLKHFYILSPFLNLLKVRAKQAPEFGTLIIMIWSFFIELSVHSSAS